jgi:hypothetical protein
MHFSVTDITQLTIFLVSLSVFLQKPVPFYLKFFPVYFFYFLILDLVIEYTSSQGIHNTGFVNASGILEFCFYFFVIKEIILNLKVKRVILYVMVIFPLFTLINMFFIQKKVGFNPVNFTIGTLVTVVFCIYYFVELFQKTEAPSLTKLPAFWIASAILFNVVLVFPMFALVSFMQETTVSSIAALNIIFNNMGSIFNIIIILTYILYSIGFLCRIRINKSTL